MNVVFDREKNRVLVAAKELAAFARTGRNAASKLYFGGGSTAPDEFASGRELSLDIEEGALFFTLFGRADLVWQSGGKWTLEIIKEAGRISSVSPAKDAHFLAEGVVTAHMLCREKGLSGVTIRYTYMQKGSSSMKTFECYMDSGFISKMTNSLVSRAAPFIRIEEERMRETVPALRDLAFPYPTIREAQRDFINDAYRAVKGGRKLMVCAPTGIGKTISALYPALRAMGTEDIDKIFYLTAKTVTGNACADAVRAMAREVRGLRAVYIMAKERTCPMAHMKKKSGVSRCLFCPMMAEIGGRSYEERRDGALLELLSGENVIDVASLSACAKKHTLCPYELSLDVSEYCQVVICDYNYVFDPAVRFRRYFEGVADGRYAFLVDEAHNLPDRAREMYSAKVDAYPFLKLYKTDSPVIRNNTALLDGITGVIKKFKEITALCKSEERLDAEGESVGYYLSERMVSGVPEAFSAFSKAASLAASKDETAEFLLSEALERAGEFVRAAALFDKGFAFYGELCGPSLTLSVRCLDPSHLLGRMMNSAKSVVLFSATLTPMDYFADVLGVRDSVLLELDSPYPKENLCLFAYDAVSTRYEDREMSIPELVELIMTVYEAREGNYIVYFPSYEYMESVYDEFCECAPDIASVKQERGMSHKKRDEFISRFTKSGEGIVGFCVLGGAFSEGVDFSGESLIGTIIVGTGLARISAEQNILADYFEKTREGGEDYAYTYPAMIKVLQAAGRVIRSEKDRGVVILADDRYSTPKVYRLFPKYWSHIKYTGDVYSLATSLERFWYEAELL